MTASNSAITDLPPHFHPSREIHIIVSILSGRHKAQEYFDDNLTPFLKPLNLKYKVHTTTSAKTVIELTRSIFLPQACKGIQQTIILLSGDGGMVDIVNTLATALQHQQVNGESSTKFVKPVICLIPMGTANALAWSSGCAADPLEIMLQGSPKSVPMFRIQFSLGARLVTNEAQDREVIDDTEDGLPTMYGCVVASWGLHASLVALSDSKEYRQHGLDRFRMAAEELLKEAHRYSGRTTYTRRGETIWRTLYGDDPKENSEQGYVMAVTVSGLEEKFKISPHTKPLESNMRLVAFKPVEPQETLRILNLAYQEGRHVEEEEVVYEEIEKIRIDVDEEDEVWRQICVDGKIVALEPGGWMMVTMLSEIGDEGRTVVDLVC